MKFLLDTDICSAHMRRPASLSHRFIQYIGQLGIPTVVLAELYAGAYKHPQASRLLGLILDLRREVIILDFNAPCAEQFGKTRGILLQQGISVPSIDLMIASVAQVHDLTLVTHNTVDYRNIPDLRLVDWLTP
jgi:tRNA(fMet)-specific endonuclease VapC